MEADETMDNLIWQSTFYGLFRWIHIVAVVMGIGGMFAMRYVFLPALAEEEKGRRGAILMRARRKLAVIVPTAIGLLIVTGAINLVRSFKTPPTPPVGYHIVFGVKLILALILFAIALMLALPSDPPNAVQRRAKFWLSMNVHLGFLIIALSVALKFLSGK